MTERANEELYTLKVIAETLNQSNDLDDMLQRVLEKLLEVTDLRTGWLFLTGENETYNLAASANLPPALAKNHKRPMCSGRCHCLSQFWEGRLNEPVNIINCKRIQDALRQQSGDTEGITHHATVPLASGDEFHGILNVAEPEKDSFSDKELNLLQSVALQIGTAIKRVKLYEQKKQKDAYLEVVEERHRLARDLHDAVNQKLFSLTYTAKGASTLAGDDQSALREALQDMQKLAQEALSEMRTLVFQLRPSELDHGLSEAVRSYAENFNLTVSIDETQIERLPLGIKTEVWRMIQEALNNVYKHAKTRHVDIILKEDNDRFTAVVKDKGEGFHVYNALGQTRTFGLKGLKERASKLGGELVINSQPGKGTSITFTCPLKAVEGEQR